eukprot:g12364.t2
MRRLLPLLLLLLLPPSVAQLVPRVVLVAAFPPELERWIERLPLSEELPFPAGAGPQVLHWNSDLQILGLVTGQTSKSAAMSVTALGHDPRFDLRHAFWLFAGIAGVDPELGSLGSVTWGRRLVDGTAVKFLDAREMPQDVIVVLQDMVWTLDLHPGGLVEWAFNLTQHIKLPDHKDRGKNRMWDDVGELDAFASLREKYTAAPARAPPRVQLGDTLSTDVFWTGSWSAGWARNWTKYWLPAESFGGQGRLGTSAMEDFAVAEALAALHRAGLVSGVAAALLVLRAFGRGLRPIYARSGLEGSVGEHCRVLSGGSGPTWYSWRAILRGMRILDSNQVLANHHPLLDWLNLLLAQAPWTLFHIGLAAAVRKPNGGSALGSEARVPGAHYTDTPEAPGGARRGAGTRQGRVGT